MLDSLETSPAYLQTLTWDLVAWNRAAAAVLTDYSKLPEAERNLRRLVFLDRQMRARQAHWESAARFVVAAFRADVTRTGATDRARNLVETLRRKSPEFAAMWSDNAVVGKSGDRAKYIDHPVAGRLTMEYSAFGVDGRPDLTLVVHGPRTPEDRECIRSLLGTPPAAQP